MKKDIPAAEKNSSAKFISAEGCFVTMLLLIAFFLVAGLLPGMLVVWIITSLYTVYLTIEQLWAWAVVMCFLIYYLLKLFLKTQEKALSAYLKVCSVIFLVLMGLYFLFNSGISLQFLRLFFPD